MPPRDPAKIQLDFPLLTADLIDQLNLVGTIGLLDFAPTVLPVFIIGDRDLSVDAIAPTFTSSQIFSAFVGAPVANAVVLDTGELPAGTYDVFGQISFNGGAVGASHLELQLRNAANAATLAVLGDVTTTIASNSGGEQFPIVGLEIAADERLRVQMLVTTGPPAVSATIGARLRPVP